MHLGQHSEPGHSMDRFCWWKAEAEGCMQEVA